MELNDRFWLSLGIMALAYLTQHFFAWWRRLKRLEAYTIGVATLFGGIAIWTGLTREYLLLCAFPAVAGLSVGASWLYDRVANWRVLAETDAPGQRAPNSRASREVRTLEDALFTLSDVLGELDIAAMRMAQRARTEAECANLEAIARVKVKIEDARAYLQHLHPERLPN
ncbi:MAG TPA: hypothetical protein VM366_13870 [Anaerolineae bacterium]|nr:hypothetical protein [Anaerolineae bacterium]